MALQDNAREAIQALTEILTPNGSGTVTFGAHNEPLRESQTEGLAATKKYLESGETKGHIVMPGGSGKTRLGIALAYAMYKHNRNSLFVVPSQQALRDFVNKANDLGIFAGQDVGAVYEGEKRVGKLTFITYASLLRRVLGEEAAVEVRELAEADHRDAVEHHEAPPPQQLRIDPKEFDLAIWDEAHMYLTVNAQSLLHKFEHAVNIGLTATPRYYAGKEVGGEENPVFGKLIKEIDLDTAKKRGEVCDFENILIDTGIQTGIELTSPDQEEGAQVSGAINRRDRNLIFADSYKNANIKVIRGGQEKKYTLTGEPTIVFGASIDHVHDMADAINAALTPALKTDTVFRQRLRDKGIDPDDPELVIAAPIHTGASPTNDEIGGMSLNQRNALVDRYHNRKVLMLCATSVLQQSFDSPMTSVVMDAVPRQTYVGVGQAGMRATRPGKGMAFIINTQDADHPSLTFEDFHNCRGSEEGVVVEIANRNGNGRRQHTPSAANGDAPVASYNLTYGTALNQLAAQRRTQRDPLYREDFLESSRHFTTHGYARINNLIVRIGTGDKAAVTEFIEAVQPWIDRTRERIEGQLFGEQRAEERPIDEERINDAATDALMDTLKLVSGGSIGGWHRFSTNYQGLLRRGLERVVAGEDRNGLSEDKRISWKRALKIPEKKEEKATDDPYFHEALDEVLRTLTPRERDVVIRRNQGETLEQLSQVYDVNRERIRQIEAKAVRKLQSPMRSQRLEPWMPEKTRPLTILLRDQQRKVLEPMEDDFIAQKHIIFDMLKCDAGYVPTTSIQEATGIKPWYIGALTDIKNTEINDNFLEALTDESLARMKANLPRYEGITAANMRAFDGATRELKNLLQRFTEAGGKPLPREHSAVMSR